MLDYFLTKSRKSQGKKQEKNIFSTHTFSTIFSAKPRNEAISWMFPQMMMIFAAMKSNR